MSYSKSQPDPDALVSCPYDPLHKVKGSSWHSHLIRCKRVNELENY